MTIPEQSAPIEADAEWDAGDLACGHLLIELRKHLRRMPGGVLKITSRDPASPDDLPTWCRLTGNAFLHHETGTASYWIRSRSDWS